MVRHMQGQLEIAEPECVAGDFAGEIVALNLKSGVCLAMRDLAAGIWNGLAAGHPVETVLSAISAHNAALKPDAQAVIERLCREEMLRPSETARDAATVPAMREALDAGRVQLAIETYTVGYRVFQDGMVQVGVNRSTGDARGAEPASPPVPDQALEHIIAERQGFLVLVEGLRRQLGDAPASDDGGHPQNTQQSGFSGSGEQSAVTTELQAAGNAGIQLKPAELAPIIHAIQSTPRCGLLVFGCGNDSALWELVNRHGTTVFLEDNDEWIAMAQAALSKATVEKVEYGTRMEHWHRMLGADELLALDLPPSVSGRKWNVILVDGPPGYADSCPGRMKSIFAASRLVAPNGYVFVHDCNRPLEREYSAHYLGQHRCFVSVEGRMNGYAF